MALELPALLAVFGGATAVLEFATAASGRLSVTPAEAHSFVATVMVVAMSAAEQVVLTTAVRPVMKEASAQAQAMSVPQVPEARAVVAGASWGRVSLEMGRGVEWVRGGLGLGSRNIKGGMRRD